MEDLRRGRSTTAQSIRMDCVTCFRGLGDRRSSLLRFRVASVIQQQLARPDSTCAPNQINCHRFRSSGTGRRCPFVERASLARPKRTRRHTDSRSVALSASRTRYAGAIRTWRSTPALHTPTLRSPGFEDEDEREAPHEGDFFGYLTQGLKPWANICNRFAVIRDRAGNHPPFSFACGDSRRHRCCLVASSFAKPGLILAALRGWRHVTQGIFNILC